VKFLSIKLSFLLSAAALAALAQPPAAPLAFEVATIKPAEQITPAMVQAGKMHVGLSIDQARVDIGYVSLNDMVVMAYKVKPYQVQGPDWLKVQRFDVLAKMPPGATKDDVPAMMQGLLKERFKMEIHRDSAEHSVYALIVGKGGIKMKEAEPDAPVKEGEPAPLAKGEIAMGSGENAVRVKVNADGKGSTAQTAKNGVVKTSMGPDNTMHYEVSKMDMSGLADMFSAFLDKPVVDMTELKGKYQIAFDLSMQDLMAVARKNGANIPAGAPGAAADAAPEPGGSSIFTAVQQFGLKLDSRKAPMEIIVVDRAEKMPTEN
jgi:uncharacterized protein (TIGR03435 family)